MKEKSITSQDFDKKFDKGEDLTKYLDLDQAFRPGLAQRRVKSLRETANALDMQLVYGLVPKDGSLDALIDRKARCGGWNKVAPGVLR